MGKHILYQSIDECLGPARTRFFGSGHRRARHLVRDVTVVPPGLVKPAGVTATVSVAYPRDWSRKAMGEDLRPHLSTIDTLLLGAQLSEVYLAGALGLDADRLRLARLRRVTLHAGAAPQEDLVDLVATAVPLRSVPIQGRDEVGTTFDCSIGAMRARCLVEHAPEQPAGVSGTTIRYDGWDRILAPATDRYYGDGFRHRGVDLTDVVAQLDDRTVSAVAQVRPDATPGSQQGMFPAGLDGAYQPTMSMVEAFVTGLQLAQVLMYELDGVCRQQSGTLWMLNTALEAGPAPVPLDGPTLARFRCPGWRLLPVRDETWRNLDIVGTVGGLSLRSSIAHRLPEAAAAAAKDADPGHVRSMARSVPVAQGVHS